MPLRAANAARSSASHFARLTPCPEATFLRTDDPSGSATSSILRESVYLRHVFSRTPRVDVLANIADAVEWGSSFWEHFCQNLRFFGIFLIGMTVLSALGYLLYAAIMGGKYIVLFEMDERGVNHKQLPKQAKKAHKISELTMLAGAAAGNPSVAGIGINSARSEMYSEFKKVRSVKPFPRRDLIKVNERFGKNQVYASKQDFDFVLDYILNHVTILET